MGVRVRGAGFGSLSTVAMLATAFLASGCASPNVNPASPQAQTGYVDLHADSSGELSWNVQVRDAAGSGFRKAFYNLDPLEDRILRLAFAPGNCQLRVTFLNRVIAEPVVFEVQVRDGQITPVQIKLVEVGATSVQTKSTSAGGTAYGRYGRRTKIGSYETSMYRVTAAPQEPQPYQIKQHMPYAH